MYNNLYIFYIKTFTRIKYRISLNLELLYDSSKIKSHDGLFLPTHQQKKEKIYHLEQKSKKRKMWITENQNQELEKKRK